MISQHILEKLFDSHIKIRLFKLFLRNPDESFSYAQAHDKLLIKTNEEREFKKELQKLRDIEFVLEKKKSTKKDGESVYSLNPSFTFLNELKNLVLRSSPVDQQKLAEKIHNLGKVRLAVLSGVFMGARSSTSIRTDILVVSDVISERRFTTFIKTVEAEVGVDIKYTLLSTEEYEYRVKMFDRFLRDIFERPHVILIGKQ